MVEEKQENTSSSAKDTEDRQDKKHSVAAFVILVIFALVIGIGIWWYLTIYVQGSSYKSLLKWDKKSTTTEDTTTESRESSENIPDYAKNWHEFKNSNYGFTFRYPKNTASTTDIATCNSSLYIEKTENPALEGEEWIYGNFFMINVKNDSQSLEQIIKTEDPGSVRTLTKITNTGADKAIKIDTFTGDYEGYPPLSYVLALFKKDGRVFRVMSLQNPTNFDKECMPANTDQVNQIVDTFRF